MVWEFMASKFQIRKFYTGVGLPKITMYITKENIKTLNEIVAFIDGQLDAVEDVEYWHDFLHRANKIKDKAIKQYESQNMTAEIKKRAKQIVAQGK